MINRLLILWVLFACLLLTGCDPYTQDNYKEYYVVESYLIVNRNLPEVKVSKTLPIDERYSFEKAALSNAAVNIQRLDTTGSVQKTYTYHLRKKGVYRPDNIEPVLPEYTYRLNVSFPNGDSVQSETLVPGDFQPVGSIPDSAVYQSPQKIIVHITPSFYPGRQSYFIFTVNVRNPSPDQLTPFYADVVETNTTSENNDIADYYINSSGIINEKNYDRNPDGTLTLKLPWLSVAFYGDNLIVANAIDDNMYDFVRTQDVQTGGSTLPPGQIQNINYHVDGGIGIFGSMASDTIAVFIKKQGN